ncbi:sulfite exporter TauE/SafE family protein [Candidatus Undinarchaeota archaeon]
MVQDLTLLLITAASLGFIHTLFGPDHYVPFIVMSKARKWSKNKTMAITALCGVGHVLGSIILGFIGIFLGVVVFRLEAVEAVRGDLAAWSLIIFGFAYLVWGLHALYTGKEHTHTHLHKDGKKHEHTHKHTAEHEHVHFDDGGKGMTPWILFVIFVLGPCEPLIPLLMYPAAVGNLFNVFWVSLVFGLVTVATMTTMVLLISKGIDFLPIKKLQKYIHVISGLMIFLSGMAIVFLGL